MAAGVTQPQCDLSRLVLLGMLHTRLPNSGYYLYEVRLPKTETSKTVRGLCQYATAIRGLVALLVCLPSPKLDSLPHVG